MLNSIGTAVTVPTEKVTVAVPTRTAESVSPHSASNTNDLTTPRTLDFERHLLTSLRLDSYSCPLLLMDRVENLHHLELESNDIASSDSFSNLVLLLLATTSEFNVVALLLQLYERSL